jgi:hypothetical protein
MTVTLRYMETCSLIEAFSMHCACSMEAGGAGHWNLLHLGYYWIQFASVVLLQT